MTERVICFLLPTSECSTSCNLYDARKANLEHAAQRGDITVDELIVKTNAIFNSLPEKEKAFEITERITRFEKDNIPLEDCLQYNNRSGQ